MLPKQTHSAYDLLLYVVRTARSVPYETKKSLLKRIEADQWDEPMRLQLRDLCMTEARLRKEKSAALRDAKNDAEDAMNAPSPETDAEEDDAVTAFESDNAAAVAEFEQECDVTERNLNRSAEADARHADDADIDSLRAFLKQGA